MSTTPIRSHGWRCQVPGCRGCGAGYGSQTQANRAARRHAEQAHRLTERVGVAR